MNLLQWPDTYKFSFKPSRKKDKWKNGKLTGNQLYDFEYVETFKTVDEKLMQRTIAMVEPLRLSGMKFQRVGKKGFKISGTMDRETIASAIVGEFFNHSAMGSLTLGQLWQGMTVGHLAKNKIMQDEEAAVAT